MADIYNRLKEVGFSSSYVRGHVLPDWWEDSLAVELENRRLAEMAISRTLKIPLSHLVDQRTPLIPSDERTARFRRWQDTAEDRLFPTVVVARRVCELVLASADIPDLRLKEANELREEILKTQPYVSLTPLLQHCWRNGIPVVHLKQLPAGARRLAGLALMVAGRPCIALAGSRNSPAWLAWPLAHEIGHIANGHCQNEDTIDLEINLQDEDSSEMVANKYAKVLLYGQPTEFSSKKVVDPQTLAEEAERFGQELRIHPACVVTNYGFRMRAYDVATAALKRMGLATGGAEPVRTILRQALDLSRLSPTDRHFLESVTGISE